MDNSELILSELRAMRKDGCNIGATNSAHIETMQAMQKQHDQRINAAEVRQSSTDTKIEAMPEQIATKVIKDMNGSLKKSNKTMIPIKLFGGAVDTEVPASWFGWATMIAAMLTMLGSHHAGTSEVKEALVKFEQIVGTNLVTRID